LLGHVGIVREVLQKLVRTSGVSILDTIWPTLCSYAAMHKIFISLAQKMGLLLLALTHTQKNLGFMVEQ